MKFSHILFVGLLFGALQYLNSTVLVIEKATYGFGDQLETNDVTEQVLNRTKKHWMTSLFGDPAKGKDKTFKLHYFKLSDDQWNKIKQSSGLKGETLFVPEYEALILK